MSIYTLYILLCILIYYFERSSSIQQYYTLNNTPRDIRWELHQIQQYFTIKHTHVCPQDV